MKMSNVDLEKGISAEFGGTTSFQMEDAHARYFINNGVNGAQTEIKVVKETGRVEHRKLGSEDWELTFLEEHDLLAAAREAETSESFV
jgi:hypothetical protein